MEKCPLISIQILSKQEISQFQVMIILHEQGATGVGHTPGFEQGRSTVHRIPNKIVCDVKWPALSTIISSGKVYLGEIHVDDN